VAAGRRRDAVEFLHRGIGVPEEVMAHMTPPVWAALEAVAPTLVLDSHRRLAGAWHGVPDETLAPVLVEFFG
jgi:hypothetical protein